MKQKEETIRELAVLPTFLFLVLDTLVQPVDCSNFCQLARVPRRQFVSEGNYETAWYLYFSLCCDVSALPMRRTGSGRHFHTDIHEGVFPNARLIISMGKWDLHHLSVHHSKWYQNWDTHTKFNSVFWRKFKSKHFFCRSSLPRLLQTETFCSTTLIPMRYPFKPQISPQFYLVH